MIELNERLPDSGKLVPAAGTPGPHEGRRRSLRERVADRRFLRSLPTAGPPDVVDWQRWRTGIPLPREVNATTLRWLEGSPRARASELDRPDRRELERRARAYDYPGCPPDLFGRDEPGTIERNRPDRGQQERNERDER